MTFADPKGGGGTGGPDPPPPPPPPLKIHKNIGFPGNIDADPQKITKLPSQHSTVGHYQHAKPNAISMVFRWQADDGQLLVAFWTSLHPINLKKPPKVLDPLWQTFWIRTWVIGVFSLRSRGCWFKLHQRQCIVSLSKTLYPLLSTGSTQEMSQHDWKIVEWDVKHQLNRISSVWL